jgi:serine protease Do
LRSLILIFIFLISTASISLSEQKKITSEEDVRRIYQSVVKIDSIVPSDARTANSLGTIRGGNGIVIDDKHILTIGYIVVEAETITITLPNGGVVPAELAGYDHTTGFGILKTILPSKLTPLQIGNSDKLNKEDLLYVLPYLTEGAPSAVKMVSQKIFYRMVGVFFR